MNITKEIKRIMQEKGITVTALNNELNYKNGTNYSPQNLSKRLNKEDIKFGDALEILDILGYTIGVREKLPEEIGEIEGQVSFEISKMPNETTETKTGTKIDSYMEDLITFMITKYVKDNFTKTFKKVLANEMSELLTNKDENIDFEIKDISKFTDNQINTPQKE